MTPALPPETIRITAVKQGHGGSWPCRSLGIAFLGWPLAIYLAETGILLFSPRGGHADDVRVVRAGECGCCLPGPRHSTEESFLAGRTKRRVYRNTRLDLRKANPQLIANEENQDRSQCGKNEASGMISFVCRARKHVANAATDDRSDDAEHHRPEDRDVHVHHRFRDNPRD